MEYRTGAVGQEGFVNLTFQSLLLNIFLHVSWFRSSPYLFTFPVRYTTVRPPVDTPPKCGTKPIRYVTLHRLTRSALRSFAPLQKLRRNHCSYVWTKARFSIRYGVKIALVVTFISVHNGNMKNASTARAIEFDHSLSYSVSWETMIWCRHKRIF